MYKSFVLKHVVGPPIVVFASLEATILSVVVWVLTVMVARMLLDFPFLVAFVTSIVVFLMFHGTMIFFSHKDPYFLNVMLAKLRCRKTKNLMSTKDNLYGA